LTAIACFPAFSDGLRLAMVRVWRWFSCFPAFSYGCIVFPAFGDGFMFSCVWPRLRVFQSHSAMVPRFPAFGFGFMVLPRLILITGSMRQPTVLDSLHTTDCSVVF